MPEGSATEANAGDDHWIDRLRSLVTDGARLRRRSDAPTGLTLLGSP